MRENRRRLTGTVVSDKMNKTVVVAVTTTKRHPLYGKVMHITKKYKAHDENNTYKVGDQVEILECQPISRHKRWTVVSGVKVEQA
jgi:small subunit ribosomal protein S17